MTELKTLSKSGPKETKWLKGRLRSTLSHLFEFEDYRDALRVTTALISPHGDYIKVYVHSLPEGGYEVSKYQWGRVSTFHVVVSWQSAIKGYLGHCSMDNLSSVVENLSRLFCNSDRRQASDTNS